MDCLAFSTSETPLHATQPLPSPPEPTAARRPFTSPHPHLNFDYQRQHQHKHHHNHTDSRLHNDHFPSRVRACMHSNDATPFSTTARTIRLRRLCGCDRESRISSRPFHTTYRHLTPSCAPLSCRSD
ncbi:hypothetical protein K440DRAFT_144931 [Wilcoxina mikolae CBS 423.85]|nr:hypothetical protein K440DRAFT_144931 [Wilcoxina mikolae CBS 423.85]